ncbi:MFS transporter [Streptococcus hillyeri]|uniref:MFS transporter n=1 Tax=Streptococcus hillyeri TaxID=2282420 RepID=A0A3L9DV42_9STRE|nr:MFS transporter [Streptococcus hillyeri]RLY04118.1 MFS transporter [Streptococcus hillyeri]
MKKALKNKLFLATFVSDMISNFGDSLYYLALMNYVLLLPNAKFAISLVTLSESLPILTRFVMGIWADKTKNKLDTIMATQIFRVLLYIIVGVAMGFAPALWVVLVAVIVNLFSDISGQYESYLFSPISLRVVSNDDREGAMAFRQAASSILQIGFQASGVILTAFMTYQNLAFFNAGTFLVSMLIMLALRPALSKLLKENPIKMEEVETPQSLVTELKTSFKGAMEVINGIPVLKASLITIMGINAIGSTLDPIIMATIKDFKDFIIVNPATTIATVSIIFFVGNIVGSVLCTTLFKKVDLLAMIKLTLVLLAGFFGAMVVHQIYMALVVIFGAAVVSGGVNPKFSAMMYREIPEEKLATIGSGIDTLMTLGMIVSRFALSGMVLVLPAQVISSIYLLIALALMVYTIKKTFKQSEASVELVS